MKLGGSLFKILSLIAIFPSQTENIQAIPSLESSSIGMVGFKIYKNCFRAGAHWFIIVFLILINVAAQVNNIYFGLCFQLDTYVLIQTMFILLFLICILRDMFPRLREVVGSC